ncbi:MAG: alanine--tRNA ligase [Cyanobacteria bacterium P01_D01_bin.73]
MPSLTSLSGPAIREKFLSFFESQSHKRTPSASLVPDDPTVLLTIAGMLPFKPIFLGQQPRTTPRATSSQKCIRTNDIENVGRTKRHHTFFEMLGNFSFGDYFKEEAIQWAWTLSTDPELGYGLDPANIAVSVFETDDEAFELWRDKIGVPEKRILRMGEEDNFWASGPTGPCGPCSELYYDFHPELGDDDIALEDDTRFIEFYNLVFMELNRDSEGNLTPLANKNIDTGMGLERMAQILQKVPNNYETDLIFPIIKSAADIAGLDYFESSEKIKTSLKVIGDHVRAVIHLITDGVTASNLGRGYILRRLIRRVVRHGRLIGIENAFTAQVAETAIQMSEAVYPGVRDRAAYIKSELQREEEQFLKTLERGEKLLNDILVKQPKEIAGQDAFTLYDTYGFPLELTQEIAEENGIFVDVVGFEAAMEEQRQRARAAHETIDLTVQGALEQLTASVEKTLFLENADIDAPAQVKVAALLVDGQSVEKISAGDNAQILLDRTPFYAQSGGQVGDRGFLSTETAVVRIDDVTKESGFSVHFGHVERGSLSVGEVISAQIDAGCRRRAQANHTSTHLLQSALLEIVDPNVAQAGSLVAFDRLRFDFNCPRPLTEAEMEKVEVRVNEWISQAHGVTISEMPIDEAKEAGAIAIFGEKYGNIVRVVDFPGVSKELCGGTPVSNTKDIGAFKLVSETGISSGVRRIEAVSGPAILDYLKVRDDVVRTLGDRFKAKPDEVVERVTALQDELKATQKALAAVKAELAAAKSDALIADAEAVGDFKVLVANLGEIDAKSLQGAAERLQQKLGDGSAVVLGAVPGEGKVAIAAAFGKEVIGKGLQAGKFVGAIAKICGGGGGGRPNLAQAGGRDASKLPEALSTATEQLKSELG